jgi:hypothetical protein
VQRRGVGASVLCVATAHHLERDTRAVGLYASAEGMALDGRRGFGTAASVTLRASAATRW